MYGVRNDDDIYALYKLWTVSGSTKGLLLFAKEYDGKPGYCRQKFNEDLLKITVMDQIHHMIKVMCDKKEVLEKMKEGTCEKGELVSLRVKDSEYAVPTYESGGDKCNAV